MSVYIKFYDELNLGDDLFIKMLLERYQHTHFFLIKNEKYDTFLSNYKNVKTFPYIKKRNILDFRYIRILRNRIPYLLKYNTIKHIKNIFKNMPSSVDTFVSIGGSIFMQPPKLNGILYEDVEYYRYITRRFKNTFFMGCNFGPYLDEEYKINFHNIFKKSTSICFRDKKSYDLFNDIPNASFAPDIVFGLDNPYNSHNKKKNSVGFSIIGKGLRGKDRSNYIEKYVKLIELYQRNDYEINLFSFCQREGDEAIIDEIFDALKSKNKVKKVYYRGDIDSFLQTYSQMELMYCGRFHAMILSMIFNQKIYPIVYSNKMTNVLEDIGYKGKTTHYWEFHNADHETLYNDIKNNFYNISNLKEKSEQHFNALDHLLLNNK